MKNLYIALMAKALSAYTDQHISQYFETVQTDGLTEHGFPRLTANIGILIAHGIRTDLLPLFCSMMDFCCENIPYVKAANDFSVREILSCIAALEAAKTVAPETIARWKKQLKAIIPQNCYTVYAKSPSDDVYNWASFTMLSEYMRYSMGLCSDSLIFIELQICNQLRLFDSNGMYRDPNQPMVYDLVTRGLFALLLHTGYRGIYYDQIDRLLKTAGTATLKMQSVTGELPYGGRSNQFLFNEALLAIVFEYEANRYAKDGNLPLAQEFKTAAHSALEQTSFWLDQPSIRHIKNYFPLESRYGCERYAYFDKYMITTASYLYMAYLICNDQIPMKKKPDSRPAFFQTTDEFHKVFLKNEFYALEFDCHADPHYDASGLGRVHRAGAPSAICLSTPCTSTPNYSIDRKDTTELSLCSGIRYNGEWHFATGQNVGYTLIDHAELISEASVSFFCDFPNQKTLQTTYTITEKGLCINVYGKKDLAHLLPAFSFDGETHTEITYDEHTLSITYKGWCCRYATNGSISDTGKLACNRNGHYRAFTATAQKVLQVTVSIEPTGK